MIFAMLDQGFVHVRRISLENEIALMMMMMIIIIIIIIIITLFILVKTGQSIKI